MLLGACGSSGGGTEPPPAATQSVYVVDAARGDDANPGTEAQPLRTLQAGVAKLAAGVTLQVRAGDYRAEGPIRITMAASPQAPARVAAYAGEQAIVESVIVESSTSVEVTGFTIIGTKTLPVGWRDMPEVVIDDPNTTVDPNQSWQLRAASVRARYASYVTFINWPHPSGTWTWENDYSGGIDVVASRDITLRDNDVSLHTACIGLHNESANVLVENNTLHHCLDALKGERRAGAFSFTASTIRANAVSQILREGLRLTYGAYGNVIEDNRVEYTGTNHIATYEAGGYNIIRRNIVQYGGYYAETMKFPGPSAISLHSSGPDTVADSNYVAYQYDVTLHDGNGVIVDFNPDNAVVQNNIIYRPMGNGINSAKSGNARIVHNTIVEAGYQTTALTNGMGIRIGKATDVNNVIANNIIYLPRNGGILFAEGNLADQAYLDHNLFHTSGVALVGNGLDPSAAYWDLASLHAAGLCLNSIAGDPLLADPSQGRPQAGSPALARGTAEHSSASDYAGQPRSGVAPSIGAYENASN
jgi:hypothetical protein